MTTDPAKPIEEAHPEADAAPGEATRRLRFGLSARLLLLTVLFVMLSEVLIFVPSIANFRETWLRDRIATAEAAILILEAYPDGMVPPEIEMGLLERIDAKLIAFRADNMRYLIAADEMTRDVSMRQNLGEAGPFALIGMAFETLTSRGERLVHIIDRVPGGELELIIEEDDLRADMIAYAINILLLSLFISAITATAVYFALRNLMVRPMQRLMEAMVAFRHAPEGDLNVIRPSGRRDEIGLAEGELAEMQSSVQRMLHERARLAALGLAVAKVNHDLRNMLASAQLFIERIEMVPDPAVQRLAPKLIGALDRAITFTQDTLRYGRAQERPPVRQPLDLHALCDSVAESLDLESQGIDWRNTIPVGFTLMADEEHLFRVATNLMRNARQAVLDKKACSGQPALTVSAAREGGTVHLDIADNGPGIPASVKAKLFQPFGASHHKGGTGLGLTIADELVRAHGGRIRLLDDGPGATFRVELPDGA
ncbi:MAG: HAMP domain-containing sensor histidine kinase [Pseudomonadota bacterium]